MITLYETPSDLPDKTLSPWAAKVRLVLNYKRIPHRTVWFPFAEIDARCIAHGIPPNDLDPYPPSSPLFGKPHYTIPAIYDATTGAFVVDSNRILLYLEETYPGTPQIIVQREVTMAANVALEEAVIDIILRPTVIIPVAVGWMGKVDADTRLARKEFMESLLGMPIDEWNANREVSARPHWERAQRKFDVLDAIFTRAESLGCGAGLVSGGTEMTFADATVGGMLIYMQRGLGAESEDWKRVAGWNGGRWGKLHAAVQPYTTVFE